MTPALEHEIAALFALPLAEFTTARNALAGRLKKSAQSADAERVKALAKPPVSAWAVNQVYWKRRDAFDRLIEAGRLLREAQASQLTGKAADVRGSLDARREVLSELSHQAAELMRDAGHNPSPDILRRVTTTLEAVSAYTALPDNAVPGQLTADLDPPGFESLAALMPDTLPAAPVKPQAPVKKTRESKEARQADTTKITAAKLSLQQAERARNEARGKADAAGMHKRAAEERFERARAAAEEAGRRAREAADAAEKAAKALADAERTVEETSATLRSLVSLSSD